MHQRNPAGPRNLQIWIWVASEPQTHLVTGTDLAQLRTFASHILLCSIQRGEPHHCEPKNSEQSSSTSSNPSIWMGMDHMANQSSASGQNGNVTYSPHWEIQVLKSRLDPASTGSLVAVAAFINARRSTDAKGSGRSVCPLILAEKSN